MPRFVWNFTKINFLPAVFKLFYQHSIGKFLYTSWVSFQGAEVVNRKYSAIKMLLKNVQNSLEKTCARVSFLTMLQDVLKRDSCTGLLLLILWKFSIKQLCLAQPLQRFASGAAKFQATFRLLLFIDEVFQSSSEKKIKNMVFSYPPARPINA